MMMMMMMMPDYVVILRVSVGIGHGSGLEENVEGRVFGKIPAFEEVLRFLPEWAVSSKQDDGLVEVLTPFSI